MSRQTSYNPDQKSLMAHSVKIATSCTRFLINIHAHIAFTISYLDPPPLLPLQCSVTPGESISTQEKFPRTEHFPKISLLKVENFQLQNFFPTENLCRPITFYKIFFLRKIFLTGNGPLHTTV
jgi:hypothetical protein